MSSLDVHTVTFPSGKTANYIFALTSILDSASQVDELEELKSFTLKGPLTEDMNSFSPRFEEFQLSRYLLLYLLKDFKKNGTKGLGFSLSHTKQAAIVAGHKAVGLSCASLASGIGVDLEHKSRKISDSAWKRILVDPIEKTIPSINLWCLKEAAFKAHPKNQTTNNGLLLKDFLVSGDTIHCQPSQMNFEYKTIEKENYILTFSRLLRD